MRLNITCILYYILLHLYYTIYTTRLILYTYKTYYETYSPGRIYMVIRPSEYIYGYSAERIYMVIRPSEYIWLFAWADTKMLFAFFKPYKAFFSLV